MSGCLQLSLALILVNALPALEAAPKGSPGRLRPTPGVAALWTSRTLTGPTTVTLKHAGNVLYQGTLGAGVLELSGDVQPIPPPLAITSVIITPGTVAAGQGANGTVTLNRAPEQPVQIALRADTVGLGLPASITINVSQTSGSFAITTPKDQARDYWFSVIATYNGQSKLGSILVRAAPLGPAITGYTDPDGNPLPAGGSWVGSAVVIKGRGFGTQVGPNSVTPQGRVTWRGIDLSTYMWSDTQIGVVLSFGTVGSGTAPMVVTRYDGVTVTGPPVTVLTQAMDQGPQIRRFALNGTVGQVIGDGFGAVKGELWINGVPTAPLSWSDTMITWDTAVDATRARLGDAGVRRPDGRYYGGGPPTDLPPPGVHPGITHANPARR